MAVCKTRAVASEPVGDRIIPLGTGKHVAVAVLSPHQKHTTRGQQGRDVAEPPRRERTRSGHVLLTASAGAPTTIAVTANTQPNKVFNDQRVNGFMTRPIKSRSIIAIYAGKTAGAPGVTATLKFAFCAHGFPESRQS